MNPFSSIIRKQEIVLIFCFLLSGCSLYSQNFRITSDLSSIKFFLKEKPQLESLAVYSGEKTPPIGENIPAMLGHFSYEKDSLSFTPTFNFQPKRIYHLLEGQKLLISFRIPEENPSPKTQLTQIYPSGDVAPENLLKMYLYFSAPMREGFSYQHIRVSNSKGDTLSKPFLELTPELWDSHSQRLTLWFDPGRLKRDLIPNKDLGTPLEAGESYTLHISANWKDLSGNEIGSNFTHSFSVEEADRRKPIPGDWFLALPKSQNRDALSIDFGESLDQVLSMNAITVWKDGQRIEGEPSLLDNESIWAFRPHQVWETGEYRILIESRLEDLAGNNLNRLFDRDMLNESSIPEEKEIYQLTFHIKN